MSEKINEETKPLYTRDSHPHSGDPRVDPYARRTKKAQGQITLENQIMVDSTPQEQNLLDQTSRRKLKKETFYTVRPGVEFTFAPKGSEQGAEYAGTIKKPTKIKVFGSKVVLNGIASVYAVFEQDGEIKTGWFSLDEIKSKKK
jgi:hypothetical protein